MKNSPEASIPICVDLDGTLITGDSLLESVLLAIKNNPLLLFIIPFWIIGGRNYFKHKIAGIIVPKPELLPYKHDVIEYLRKEKDKGRKLILVSATVKEIAVSVAKHLGFFDEAHGSVNDYNLRAERKRRFLVEKFGEKGFDYIGDSNDDIRVWKSAASAIMIEPSTRIRRIVEKTTPVKRVFENKKGVLKYFLKAIRIQHWVKNVLIAIPLIMAHRITDLASLQNTLLAFLSFGLCASSIYIINDLMDLEADRQHPTKSKRPFASGDISIVKGLIAAPVLFILSISISLLFLPWLFRLSLITYFILTVSYSVYLKKVFLLDIVLLSILYTLRILAGSFATGIPASQWLLEFSVFLFLSLAIVKRYTELRMMKLQNKSHSKGRGYFVEDLGLLRSMGPTSGFISVLVFIFYLHSREVELLYKTPELLWIVALCLFLWLMRIWFLAHRGMMQDDPIVFTVKDKISYVIFFIVAILMAAAAVI